MDVLGSRIIKEREVVSIKRALADKLERDAQQLRREADEIERLLELARSAHG
jgi:hypothetical protein